MNRKGFTLMELVIVVGIVGILTAIAIPNFISMQDRAKEAKIISASKHIVDALQLAAEDWAEQHGGIYSDKKEDLLPLMPDQNRDGIFDDNDLMVNVYTNLRSEPQFGANANSSGQVGIVLIKENDVPAGYIITAFGEDDTAGISNDGIVMTMSTHRRLSFY